MRQKSISSFLSSSVSLCLVASEFSLSVVVVSSFRCIEMVRGVRGGGIYESQVLVRTVYKDGEVSRYVGFHWWDGVVCKDAIRQKEAEKNGMRGHARS